MLRQKTRRIVFWSWVTVYPIVAILLLTYTNGYRWRWHPFTIARTGNILATFEPKNAEVNLDGQTVATAMPARLRAIFPGRHEIIIQAAGYLPFRRTINVRPLETTFISDIFLLADAASQAQKNRQLIFTSTNKRTPTTGDAQISGQLVTLSATPAAGLILKINNATSSRDLGFGNWQIAGGDDTFLALARIDKNEIQFRPWKNLDAVTVSAPGQIVINHKFKNDNFFLIQSAFELWKMDSRLTNVTLITRLSKPIKQVIAVPDTTIILVVVPDEIIAYQLKEEQPQPLSLVLAPNITAAMLDNTGKNLLYDTSHNKTASQTWLRPLLR